MLSLILPNKNESHIFEFLKDLERKIKEDKEIIIVDKSEEEFYKRLEAYIKEMHNVRLIRQEDKGYENALYLGFKSAKGDIIAVIDPDGTYRVEDLIRVIDTLKSSNYSLVLGNRLAYKDKAMPAHISFGNIFLTKTFNCLYKQDIKDALSGLFAFKRDALRYLTLRKPERGGTLYFLIQLARRGLRIGSIDIKYLEREGSSRISKFKIGYGILIFYNVIRYVRDYKPLALFGSIGLISLLIGLYYAIVVLISYIHTGSLVIPGRAILAIGLIISGLFFIIAGLILDLLIEIERYIIEKD
ncbi:MAG: glycosyltransferase AglJ [Candidatus Micrarchaeota archaeon]|nr:MAG: glycosyltransferase AglJ [Candidatus Micrarchaeota archaeon]